MKQAKNTLSRLVEQAHGGTRVFLMNRNERVAEIISVRKEQISLRGYGMFKDKLTIPKGWSSQKAKEAAEAEFLRELDPLV